MTEGSPRYRPGIHAVIKVHHLNNSRSQRVLWLLDEIGLDYEVVSYQRDARTQRAPASLRRVHPLGKAPIIEDGSLRLAETGALSSTILSVDTARAWPRLRAAKLTGVAVTGCITRRVRQWRRCF